MNKKGFMMAEVIVVSAVIIVTLVGLYTSYNKIFSLYNQRVDYYDVNTLYELSYIRENKLYGSKNLETPYVISNSEFTYDTSSIRKLYYIDKNTINLVNTTGINSTFKEYIDYLESSLDFESSLKAGDIENPWHDLLIYEKCADTNGNDCTYAYLEVVLPPV